MQRLYYYKSDSADIISARTLDDLQNNYVQGRGQAFADLFNGIAVFTTGFAPQFVGITFSGDKQPKHPSLWSKPVGNGNPCLKPKEKGVHQRHMKESWELRKLWNEQLPTDIVGKKRESELLKILGADGPIASGGESFEFYLRGSVAYFASTFPLEGVTEILASEYIDTGKQTAAELQQVKEAANG